MESPNQLNTGDFSYFTFIRSLDRSSLPAQFEKTIQQQRPQARVLASEHALLEELVGQSMNVLLIDISL